MKKLVSLLAVIALVAGAGYAYSAWSARECATTDAACGYSVKNLPSATALPAGHPDVSGCCQGEKAAVATAADASGCPFAGKAVSSDHCAAAMQASAGHCSDAARAASGCCSAAAKAACEETAGSEKVAAGDAEPTLVATTSTEVE